MGQAAIACLRRVCVPAAQRACAPRPRGRGARLLAGVHPAVCESLRQRQSVPPRRAALEQRRQQRRRQRAQLRRRRPVAQPQLPAQQRGGGRGAPSRVRREVAEV
jgi:hypothetical protein